MGAHPAIQQAIEACGVLAIDEMTGPVEHPHFRLSLMLHEKLDQLLHSLPGF